MYWQLSSVQSLSHVQLFVTSWTAACQASLSISNSWSLLKLVSIESVMPSNHLILCHPHLLLPSIFPSIRIFQMSQFITSGGQSIGVSASASVLPINIQQWFPLGRTGWISLQSKGLSRVFSNIIVQKHQFIGTQLSLKSNSHIHTWLLETITLTRWIFVGKVMALLFNMLSRMVITILPRSKCLLISWLQSPSAVIFELPKIKSLTVFIASLSSCHEVMGPDAMILVFWMLSFKPTFSLSSFTFIKRHFSSSSLSAIRVVSSGYLRLLIFVLAILIPACASSSSAFCMMYSACKLNNQGDNIQPWCTLFPIWNQSVVLCPVLIVASWPAYRFLMRQVRWYGIPISWRIFQFVVIHTVKGFGVVNKAEVVIFLEHSCFFYYPTDIGNLNLWFLCLF